MSSLFQDNRLKANLDFDLERMAQKSRPILIDKVFNLVYEFLAVKSEFGSDIEKGYYPDMTAAKLIDRLILRRPLTFLSSDVTNQFQSSMIFEGHLSSS
jgi:hypothetical protein